MFAAAHEEHGHSLTGSDVGIRHLLKNNKEVTRSFQYAVGETGKFRQLQRDGT